MPALSLKDIMAAVSWSPNIAMAVRTACSTRFNLEYTGARPASGDERVREAGCAMLPLRERVRVTVLRRVNSRQIWVKGALAHLLSIKKMKVQRDLKSCCCADVTVTLTSTASPSLPAALCTAHDRAEGAEADTAALHASLNFSVVRDMFPIACRFDGAEK